MPQLTDTQWISMKFGNGRIYTHIYWENLNVVHIDQQLAVLCMKV